MMMCALLLAGGAVYAQSPSVDARICADMLSGWAELKQKDADKKAETRQVSSIDKAVKRANIKHAREEAAAQAPAEEAKKAVPVQSADSAYPTYLYGREGHMMALGNAIRYIKKAAAQSNQTSKPAADQPTQKKPEAAVKKDKNGWEKLGDFVAGKKSWETEEQYAARMQMRGYASTQPFK